MDRRVGTRQLVGDVVVGLAELILGADRTGLTADIDGVAAVAESIDHVGLAVQRLAAPQHQDRAGGIGIEDRLVGVLLAPIEHRDVRDQAGAKGSKLGLRTEREGAVDGRHLPQLAVGEVAAEVVAVELCRAGQLTGGGAGAGVGPVRADGERAAEAVKERHLGGVAVEADVGARRPDDLRVVPCHAVVVGRGEADGVDVGDVGLDHVDADEAVDHAGELADCVVVDALSGVRHVGGLASDLDLRGVVVPAAVVLEVLV